MERDEIERRLNAAAAKPSLGQADEETVEAFRRHIAKVCDVPEHYLTSGPLSGAVLRVKSAER